MNEITGQPAAAPSTHPYASVPNVPPKKRLLVKVGVALGAVVGVVAGKAAVTAVLDGGPSDAGRYRLAPPASFQGLTLQDSGPRVDAIKLGQGPRKPGTKQVAVVYADRSGTARLVVSGAAGRFDDRDPGSVLTRGLHDMGAADAVPEPAGTPEGAAMRCGTVHVDAGTLPVCMWADHSSLVTVTVPVENEPVALAALAEETRALRGVMEVRAS
ncbi:hypothetical protein ABZ934_10195 [Streptomyces sp. NPDC046557]|uniref:hypothetical protein n=1 Tax=Streptomyces sp. NPDC046557 TaxID=3155372 RepID=UPI0033E899D2